jgi:hypothetical protein
MIAGFMHSRPGTHNNHSLVRNIQEASNLSIFLLETSIDITGFSFNIIYFIVH